MASLAKKGGPTDADTGLSRPTGWQLQRMNGEKATLIDPAPDGQSYAQADFDTQDGTWSLTYNVGLDQAESAYPDAQFRFRALD